MEKGLRVLISSHGYLVNSSYGKIQRGLADLLKELGYDVYCHSWFTLGRPSVINGIKMLPNGMKPVGQDVIPFYIKKYRPEVLFTIGDPGMYEWLATVLTSETKWVSYTFVEENSLPKRLEKALEKPYLVVSPNDSLHTMLATAGTFSEKAYPPIDHLPFHELDEAERDELRGAIKIKKDDVVFGALAMNVHNKNLDLILMAFSKFLMDKTEKGKFKLYLMSEARGGASGWDLETLIDELELNDNVIIGPFSDRLAFGSFVDDEDVNRFYNVCDAYINVSSGEGFSLTNLESGLVGVPNIIIGIMPLLEIFTEDGKAAEAIVVPPKYSRLDNGGGLRLVPDVDDIVKAMNHFVEVADDTKEKSKKFSVRLKEKYFGKSNRDTWKRIMEHI